MRSYPTDSQHAAARLLAMALVADGNYSFTELLEAAHGEWTGSARMDESSRQQLLDEVRDPALRARIVALCGAVVQADGEAALLDALTRAWREQPAGALS